MKRLVIYLVILANSQTASANTIPGLKLGKKIQVHCGGARPVKQIGNVAGINGDLLYLTSGGEFTINGAITNAGESLSFPYGGARYNAKTDTLSGIGIDGDTMRYSLEDISSIQVQFLKANAKPKTTFDRSTARRRLQFGAEYPDLSVIPVDSIQQIKAWHKPGLLAPALSILGGTICGVIVASTEDQDTSYEYQEFIFWYWIDTIVHSKASKVARDITTGIAVGCVVAYFLGRAHWNNVAVREPTVSVMPLYRNKVGLLLTARF